MLRAHSSRMVGEVSTEGLPVARTSEGLAIVFTGYGRDITPWLGVAANVGPPLKTQVPVAKGHSAATGVG